MKHLFGKAGTAIVVALALNVGGLVVAQTRNPIGERADYALDRSSGRTSSIVRSGSMTGYVVDYLPDNDPAAFETRLDYNLRLQIFGNYNGSVTMPIDAPFFTPGFMERLRETGYYESPRFKLQHMGFTDATTMSGMHYPDCDLVRIYDIDYTFQYVYQAGVGPMRGGDIDDLEIMAQISYGVPVLGAVKLDISGNYQGIDIRAGADYEP